MEEKNNEPEIVEIKEKNKKDKPKKIRFFKRIAYSVVKLDKYAELKSDGVKKAISYLTKLSFFVALILSCVLIIGINKEIDNIADHIEKNVPDFRYVNGTITVENPQVVRINDNDLGYGNIIVDLETEDEETIKAYELELASSPSKYGSLFLKDKYGQVHLIENEKAEDNDIENIKVNYVSYDMIFGSLTRGAKLDISKDQVVDFMRSNGKVYLLGYNYATYLIIYFISIFITSFVYILLLAILGRITCYILKVKLNFKEMLAIATYSSTLSIIINAIYLAIVFYYPNISMSFLNVAYIAIAYIYMTSVIFLNKCDNIKE